MTSHRRIHAHRPADRHRLLNFAFNTKVTKASVENTSKTLLHTASKISKEYSDMLDAGLALRGNAWELQLATLSESIEQLDHQIMGNIESSWWRLRHLSQIDKLLQDAGKKLDKLVRDVQVQARSDAYRKQWQAEQNALKQLQQAQSSDNIQECQKQLQKQLPNEVDVWVPDLPKRHSIRGAHDGAQSTTSTSIAREPTLSDVWVKSTQPEPSPFDGTPPLPVTGTERKELLMTRGAPFAHGGFADVYRGILRDANGDRRAVAVKVFRQEGIDASRRECLAKRIMRETRIWASLDHPNVLPFLGCTDSGNRLPFLVSDFCAEGMATTYLRSDPSRDPVPILRHVAEALQYLHGRQPPIVHGDLKGSNVLIAADGRALLGDFGLARILHESGFATGMTTSLAGASLNFMAPELLVPPDEALPRATVQTDCHMYASLVYELLTGNVPFAGLNAGQVVMAIFNGKPPDRPSLQTCGRLTDVLWDMMMRCWASECTRRPTMAEILSWRIF